MLAGENKYFTGKLCKNGHMSYRYVQSGSCYDCINSGKFAANSPTIIARGKRLNEISETIKAKLKIKDNLVLVKVRVFPMQRDDIAVAAWAMAAMRYPELLPSDIDPKTSPTNNHEHGGGMYAFYCHEDDISALRDIAATMFAAKQIPINMVSIRANISSYDPPDTTPPISFN